MWRAIVWMPFIFRRNANAITYLFSSFSHWYWMLVVFTLFAFSVIVFIPTNDFPFNYLQASIGFLFMLFAPGYSLIRLLFPEKTLDAILRLSLVVGLSISMVILNGLLLNYTFLGIRTVPVTVFLLIETTILATLAEIRDYEMYKRNQS